MEANLLSKKNASLLLIFIFIVETILIIFITPPLVSSADKINITDENNEIVNPVNGDQINASNFKSESFILIDAFTGKIITENNSFEKRPIASITKIMSMILVMDAIKKGDLMFDDVVPVSEYAYGFGGSQVYLDPRETFTVHEMLKAVAIHSANDATVALAEKVAGSEEAFVELMNEKAKKMGMNDTHFVDCSGLKAVGNYSTANDVAIMSREVVHNYPEIFEYTKIVHDTFRNGEFSLDNTNELVKNYQGAIGLKTGYISESGYCLSAVAKRDSLTLISVVLGAPDSETRFEESKKLLDYGFSNFEIVTLDIKDTEAGLIKVDKGVKTSVKALISNDIVVLIKKDTALQVDRVKNFEPQLTAPVKKGQKVGEIIYEQDGQEIARVDVIAEENVEKASFFQLFVRMIKGWFGINT